MPTLDLFVVSLMMLVQKRGLAMPAFKYKPILFPAFLLLFCFIVTIFILRPMISGSTPEFDKAAFTVEQRYLALERAYEPLDDTISMLVSICISIFIIVGYIFTNTREKWRSISTFQIFALSISIVFLVLSLFAAYYSRMAMFTSVVFMDIDYSSIDEIIAFQALSLLIGFCGVTYTAASLLIER